MTRSAFDPSSCFGEATERLFEIADPFADPEGLITKFLAFEVSRQHGAQRSFDSTGNLQDRLAVLMWYLTDHLRQRNYEVDLPLSARQIAFLNGPAAIAGASPAVTVALHNFLLRERPDLLDTSRPEVLRAALYWWCFTTTPRARLFDTLVTEEQIAVLRQNERSGEDFSLNAFMTLFYEAHAELHVLDMSVARDRAAFFHYLVLLSYTQPFIARFLPSDLLRRALRARFGGGSAFDQVLAKFALGNASLDAGATLHAKGDALIALSGQTLTGSRIKRTPLTDVGQCYAPCSFADRPIEPGVAVIGPLDKASGLGQAARLSYAMLADIPGVAAPSALVFDLDNPAPVSPASGRPRAPHVGPRAVNLIHLNAESLPLAFAYLPRATFAESYNIGYFFWELDLIPSCHHLALDLVDEIWVSSEYNREIYSRYTHKPVVNVGMAVEPLPDIEAASRADFGLDPHTFVFLATFDSFSFVERKNPLGIIEAFRRAFPLGGENVQLLLKTQNRDRVHDAYQLALWRRIDRAIAADPRILLVNDTLRYDELLALKRACNCYVSLHRSEGWGFGLIEAMQIGLPVIATAYSGNLEFCNDETSFLVEYDLIGVREEEYIFVERGSRWAAPRVASAAKAMRAVVADQDMVARKVGAARQLIADRFTREAVSRRYARHLEGKLAGALRLPV